MLRSLLTELVEPIVHLSLPEDITGNTYSERQATLRALGLVSRKLRTVAQPILDEVVWVNGERKWRAEHQEQLKRTASMLRLAGFDTNLAELAGLPNLRVLMLFGIAARDDVNTTSSPASRSLQATSVLLDYSTYLRLTPSSESWTRRNTGSPSICLSNDLSPSQVEVISLRTSMHKLLSTCQEKGVEVVFHDFDERYIPVAPRHFIEFARERKARIEAERAAEQGQQ
ncbi:hypothetical protein JCM8547_001065 [Rhodosporidiobolus lusitaniae]